MHWGVRGPGPPRAPLAPTPNRTACAPLRPVTQPAEHKESGSSKKATAMYMASRKQVHCVCGSV